MCPKGSPVISELWLCRRPMIRGKSNWIFPVGFIQRLEPWLKDLEPGLHLFSGGYRIKGGINVDIDPSIKPDILANAEQLPFSDNTFRWCLSDPPYSRAWANQIWGVKYYNVRQVQSEIIRVVEPGGLIMWFHIRTFNWPKSCRTVAYVAVMAGNRNRIRILHILQNGLFKGEPVRCP